MTLTYVCALAFLAALTVAGYLLPQAGLRQQQFSAAVLNMTAAQYALLERTALLAESFITARDSDLRERYRRDLLSEIARMEQSHAALLASHANSPTPFIVRALYFESPTFLDHQVRHYVVQVRKLAALTTAELNLDHSLFQYVSTEASGKLAEGLVGVTREYQRYAEAGVQRLRWITVGVLVGTLTSLTAMGVFLFRPMVRRVQAEHAALHHSEEAKRRAERLAVVGTMAAKVAHEIRNPLGSIRLNLDSVREEIAPLIQAGVAYAHLQSLLQAIDSEVSRIQRITDSYLKFARLPQARRERVSLNEFLTQGLALCRSVGESRQVKLQTAFDATLPAIDADRDQLWQAFLNVIRNAADAMPTGGTLTVRTARVGYEVLISVTDTGHGMTAEQRSEIFKPFFTAKEGGTGLGLVLTHQIITEHGGRIDCHSAPGQGTTFTIGLPLSKET